ncbi:MAG TPA: hypothetical protein VFF66_04150 [Brevundimonas sp.]|nr:hypothetical protein [Brevundimonas sp.]
MAELKDIRWGNGTVRYFSEVEPTPTTSKTTGNVTVNNMGQPGLPAYYEVTYMLSCDFEASGVEITNHVHWTAALTGVGRDAPYGEVEAEGARQIAPMLRSVADQIEKLVAEFDANLAAKKDE